MKWRNKAAAAYQGNHAYAAAGKTPAQRLAAVAEGAAALVLAGVSVAYFQQPAYWTAPVGLVLFLLLRYLQKVWTQRLLLYNGIFSVLLAASFVLGGKVNTSGKVPSTQVFQPMYRSDGVYFLALAVTFCIVFSCLSDFLGKHPLSAKQKYLCSSRTIWLGSSIFLFLCWIPALLVFFPGGITWDSTACAVRALGKAPLSNQQPVLYILLMRPFLLGANALGFSTGTGVGVFLAVQTLAMAVMVGYFPAWLAKKQFSFWVAVPVLAYFALNPIFAVYAGTMWKDVLFGALILLYTLQVYDILESKGEALKHAGALAGFLTLNLLVCFMRNNGYYIVLVTLVVLAVLYQKQWKRLLPAFLAVLILVPVVQGPGYKAMKILPSPFAESVGVPLQQMSYTVVCGGKMTARQKAYMENLLPQQTIKQAYRPFTADGIKFHKQFNGIYLEEHKAEFFKTWLGMLVPNFSLYVKAYAMETLGYWHMGTTNWVAAFGVAKGCGAEQMDIVPRNIAGLAANQQAIKNHISYTQRCIPFVSWILNIGFLVWAAVFALFQLLQRRDRRRALTLLPGALLWLTLMVASPTYCEFRYLFFFALQLPLAVFLSFPVRSAPLPEKTACSGQQELAAETADADLPDEIKI